MNGPYYDRHGVTVLVGDCLDILVTLPDSSIDAVVTDPPYGLEFMGKDWDRPWAVGMSTTGYTDGAQRLARPAFGDSRNANCRTCKGRQRGEKRCTCPTPNWDRHPREDMHAFQQWCEAWAAECLRVLKPGGHLAAFGGTRTYHRLASGIEDAGFEVRDSIGSPSLMAWVHGQGFPKGKTQLKPAWEPIVVARKQPAGTVGRNVEMYGTGALNIDACRTAHADAHDLAASQAKNPGRGDVVTSAVYGGNRPQQSVNVAGRWPTNVLLDEDAAAELDAQSGILHSQDPATRASKSKRVGTTGFGTGESVEYADKGGASRFFPVFRWEAKAPTLERPQVDGVAHPTVKPLALMRWLVRLLTPPGGLVLDPFAGSGTTLHAARAEGFRAIGIEREPTYLPLIKARLDARPRAASGTQTATDNEPMDLLDLLTEDGAA